MSTNYLFIFCSGFTFAVGGLNLVIGLSKLKDRSYLYFGLLSLFASLFLFSQISSIYDLIFVGFTDAVSIFTAAAFYALFVWFIGEYTGFKITKIQVAITFVLVIDVILYFLLKYSIVSRQLWELIANLTILSISLYGIVAGLKGLKEINILWKTIYLLMMIGLFMLTILVGLSQVFDIHLIFDPEGFVTLLDFFPVFFSIITGSKMSHDVVRSYQLDTEIKLKERKWSNLMENINLLVVELDKDRNINYVNSFFNKFTGFSMKELIGKNWFMFMNHDYQKSEVNGKIQNLFQGTEIQNPPNFIRSKSGTIKSVQWSNIHLYNLQGEIIGSMSIGADVTECEVALNQIKNLKAQLEKENLILKKEINWREYSSEIIGESDSLAYVLKRAIQVSITNSTVLLEGETGVGKELFANLIHRNSIRRHKPFIKVNCATLPKELIESELFGHEKGSFSGAIRTRLGRFELADRGTIFLDEIGELPIELQAKLLRVLQSGEFERIGSEQTEKVDIRVIAATNRDLQEDVKTGIFRQDLFYRLNVYPITIPPLRQRKKDIPILIRYFTNKIGKKIGRIIKHISKADLTTLGNYEWPGNIRELENIVERAIINSAGDTLEFDQDQIKSSMNSVNTHSQQVLNTSLSENQKAHIVSVLEDCEWKINGIEGAAYKLGMPPSTLRSKMKKLKIVRPNNLV